MAINKSSRSLVDDQDADVGVTLDAQTTSQTMSPQRERRQDKSSRDEEAIETLFASYLDSSDTSFEYHKLPLIDAQRYPKVGYFGRGGMGEVKRVFDRMLGREVAMKVMHRKYTGQDEMMARFLEEAQATAQLQHPSIVPVYDMGRLEDGRLWFTMKEVKGKTLTAVIQEVHMKSATSWEMTDDGWHLRKLVSVFTQVCEAVAYAHERGVMHRDLKPQNIMLGERGEVWVVDWGLVKVLNPVETPRAPDQAGTPSLLRSEISVITDRSQDDSQGTMLGTISGTPAYMSPEQSRGDVTLDIRTDVYSLGAVLYEILCGRPPYHYEDEQSGVSSIVREIPPLPVEDVLLRDRVKRSKSSSKSNSDSSSGSSSDSHSDSNSAELLLNLSLPTDLVRVCQRAMSRERDARYASVTEFIRDLSPWLEGTKRRDRALELVRESDALHVETEELVTRAARLRGQARERLQEIELWRGEAEKAHLWALEDEAVALEREVATQRVKREAMLRSALQYSSDLLEAHLALAQLYRDAHERAERSDQSTLNAELELQEVLTNIPEQHPQRREHVRYLRGEGALTLITDLAGAEVLLYRYELYHRRLVPQFQRSLGVTPLIKVPLEPGSYLCKIKHPATIEVLYPVYIERGTHWDGVPPEGGDPAPIYLPRLGELSPDECYIPAGWFWSGGDDQSPKPLPKRRLWCDPLVYRRFPVTNREFMTFLHELVDRGDEELALRYAPREDGTNLALSTLIYDYHEGRFSFKEEEKWAKWQPDWPAYAVDWFGANAYAEWLSEREGRGRQWRLPGDLEWEKVVRGVDGRPYPWGEFFDPSWACMRDSHPGGTPSPASVYDYPYDESVYGVRGVSGNARIWCLDVWSADGPEIESPRVPEPTEGDVSQEIYRTLRGGSWYNSSTFLRACYRFDGIDKLRFRLLGFRLARRFVPQAST